eukprot:sb/3464901/
MNYNMIFAIWEHSAAAVVYCSIGNEVTPPLPALQEVGADEMEGTPHVLVTPDDLQEDLHQEEQGEAASGSTVPSEQVEKKVLTGKLSTSEVLARPDQPHAVINGKIFPFDMGPEPPTPNIFAGGTKPTPKLNPGISLPTLGLPGPHTSKPDGDKTPQPPRKDVSMLGLGGITIDPELTPIPVRRQHSTPEEDGEEGDTTTLEGGLVLTDTTNITVEAVGEIEQLVIDCSPVPAPPEMDQSPALAPKPVHATVSAPPTFPVMSDDESLELQDSWTPLLRRRLLQNSSLVEIDHPDSKDPGVRVVSPESGTVISESTMILQQMLNDEGFSEISDLDFNFEDEESQLNNMSLTDLGADLMADPALAEALQNMNISDDNDSVFGGSTISTDIPRTQEVRLIIVVFVNWDRNNPCVLVITHCDVSDLVDTPVVR